MELASAARMLAASANTWPTEIAQRVEQARKRRRRGDSRRALVLLREACCLAGDDPKLWAMYGVQCWWLHKRDEARTALRQALWLRERARDSARARVLRGLLLAMESACAPDSVRAA